MARTNAKVHDIDCDDDCCAGSHADAVRSKVDGLYAEADDPRTSPARARELAGKAHRLLATIEPAPGP
ncbi:hypothetical protein [Actinomadura sp. K4S16]|uniref:hypothetical protein n=1 Tax=Actinomadura sp. K4S16 TaxID=1316147 RepID=UPI0011EF84C6|nr:hypothetical protein [Actinomadura sp. K4S16]